MTTTNHIVSPVKSIQSVRRITLLAGLLFFCHFLSAQTNISGVVNTYYKVIEVIPAKACVRLNTVVGLGFNDRAMLVQMKGVAINTTSASSAFGDTTALNNAGNYELTIICNVHVDSVFFDYMLLNNYTVANQVQLVRIPEYFSARVTDTLKAAPWNNATGTGGVLGIFVDNDLILNAPISGDTNGYRGGAFRLSSSICSNALPANAYAYNATSLSPQNGATKGEGAADVTVAQSGGRGAPANGGGGGNNHDNGGAGGANLTAGGDGGGNSSTTGCTTSLVGKGGKALTSWGGKKIFMGGGGGAGHSNNGLAATNGGGHGGAIVFIRADNLIGNGYKISADGQVGGPALSDGASGGGAAGTIIMNVNNYFGAAYISANGGKGGTEDDGLNLNKCYGSGGGGSGGVIYFKSAVPAAPVTDSVKAGPAGPEVNHDGSCAAAVASSPGLAGQIIPNYTVSESLVLSNSYCTSFLPVELEWFNAQYSNQQVVLSWKTAQPELINLFAIERSNDGISWTTLNTVSANDVVPVYGYNDLQPAEGVNYYRIKVIKQSGVISYSAIKRVITPSKNEQINIYPNPASKKIFITGVSTSSQLSVFDQAGKLVWEKKIIAPQNIIGVDLPSLSSGIYIIKIQDAVRRLIIR